MYALHVGFIYMNLNTETTIILLYLTLLIVAPCICLDCYNLIFFVYFLFTQKPKTL